VRTEFTSPRSLLDNLSLIKTVLAHVAVPAAV
jgi:hypothetical protein